MFILCKYLTYAFAVFTLVACKTNDGAVAPPGIPSPAPDTSSLNSLDFSVEPADRWSLLFKRDSGWFGGDGIFSVSLNGTDATGSSDSGTRTMCWFSDTMIGDIIAGRLQPGYSMVHNSVALLTGAEPDADRLSFHWKGKGTAAPGSLFEPPQTEADKSWYWLGDGFVNHRKGDDLYIFGYEVRNTATAAGFGISGSGLIVIPHGDKPPFTEQRRLKTPLYVKGTTQDNGYAFGAGVFANTREAGAPDPDGYLYVYGVKNGPGFLEKDLMVGRVRPDSITDFDRWRFWDGAGWSLGITEIARAATITTRISDELSLTPLPGGRYGLVFQTDAIGSSVGLRLAAHPWGPFGPVIKLWDCPEVAEGPGFFTYNAKAHPHLSAPGELLISYNVNATDFFSALSAHPNLYRPRFIKIRFK